MNWNLFNISSSRLLTRPPSSSLWKRRTIVHTKEWVLHINTMHTYVHTTSIHILLRKSYTCKQVSIQYIHTYIPTIHTYTHSKPIYVLLLTYTSHSGGREETINLLYHLARPFNAVRRTSTLLSVTRSCTSWTGRTYIHTYIHTYIRDMTWHYSI